MRSGAMDAAENLRAEKVLTHARNLFKADHPEEKWPGPVDLAHDDRLMRIAARYLQRAEKELLAAGSIESVDQS
jgi:hypothetical protein